MFLRKHTVNPGAKCIRRLCQTANNPPVSTQRALVRRKIHHTRSHQWCIRSRLQGGHNTLCRQGTACQRLISSTGSHGQGRCRRSQRRRGQDYSRRVGRRNISDHRPCIGRWANRRRAGMSGEGGRYQRNSLLGRSRGRCAHRTHPEGKGLSGSHKVGPQRRP